METGRVRIESLLKETQGQLQEGLIEVEGFYDRIDQQEIKFLVEENDLQKDWLRDQLDTAVENWGGRKIREGEWVITVPYGKAPSLLDQDKIYKMEGEDRLNVHELFLGEYNEKYLKGFKPREGEKPQKMAGRYMKEVMGIDIGKGEPNKKFSDLCCLYSKKEREVHIGTRVEHFLLMSAPKVRGKEEPLKTCMSINSSYSFRHGLTGLARDRVTFVVWEEKGGKKTARVLVHRNHEMTIINKLYLTYGSYSERVRFYVKTIATLFGEEEGEYQLFTDLEFNYVHREYIGYIDFSNSVNLTYRNKKTPAARIRVGEYCTCILHGIEVTENGCAECGD